MIEGSFLWQFCYRYPLRILYYFLINFVQIVFVVVIFLKNGRQAPGQCSGKVAISYQRVSNFTDSQSAQVTKSWLPGKNEKQTRMRNFLPTTYCSGAKRLRKNSLLFLSFIMTMTISLYHIQLDKDFVRRHLNKDLTDHQKAQSTECLHSIVTHILTQPFFYFYCTHYLYHMYNVYVIYI